MGNKTIREVVAEHFDESKASMESYTVELPSKLPPRFRAYVTITRRDGKPIEGKDLQLVEKTFPVGSTRRTKRTAAKRTTGRTTKRKAAKKPSRK